MLLIVLLWPALGLNVTLTELDVFSLDLLRAFQGQDLRFNVSQPASDCGKVTVSDSRNSATEETAIPSPYSSPAYQPLINDSFVCLDSHCVTFGGNVVKVFAAGEMIWAAEVLGTVEAATLFQTDFQFVCASVLSQQRQLFIWQLPAFEPTGYTGKELQSLSSVRLRATSTPGIASLAVFGRVGSQDRLFIYELGPASYWLNSGQLLTEFTAIAEIQPRDSGFLVLDQQAGLVEVFPVGPAVYTSAKGRIQGTLLRMTPPDRSRIVVQTTTALLLLDIEPLQVLAQLDWALPVSSLWLFGHKVVVLTETQGFIVTLDIEVSTVLYGFHVNTQTFGFGCWPQDEDIQVLQEDGMLSYVTTVYSGSVELKLSETQASYTLQVTATSQLDGTGSYLLVTVTYLNSSDQGVYYGSGYNLLTQAQALHYSMNFVSNFSGLRLPLGDLFSGPALNYTVTLLDMQPSVPTMFLTIQQALIQPNDPYALQQVIGTPTFGCIVDSGPSLFVSFSGLYVILIQMDNQVEMRSVELEYQPVRCVAYSTVLWVYTKKWIFRLQIGLEPLTLTIIDQVKVDFDCQFISNNANFCLCLNATAVLVSHIYSDTNFLFTADQVSTPHLPFNLTSSCFLGETSSLLLLADSNNGLNVVDLNSVLAGKPVPFCMQLLPAVPPNTTVHFAQDKLVVMSYNLTVYYIKSNALERVMTLPRGPGLPPCWGMLVDNLMYVNQENFLNIYNLNTSVHQALYVSLPLDNPTEFLVFSLGAAHYLLCLSALGQNNFNLSDFIVVQPNYGPAVVVEVFCDGCLQAEDMLLNISVTAHSSSGQASVLMHLQMLNRGTFASVQQKLPVFMTVPTDKSWVVPLIGLFEGNDLTFSVEVNGETTTGPVVVEGGVQDLFNISLPFCNDLQTYGGRLYCLFSQGLAVVEVKANFTLAAELEWGDSCAECSALAQLQSQGHRELLVAACSACSNLNNSSNWSADGLMLVVYNWDNHTEEMRTKLQISSQCQTLKVGRMSAESASLFCITKGEYALTVQEYVLNWTADFQEAQVNEGKLLSPFNTNLTSFLPYSFDVNNLGDHFTLLVSEYNSGLVLLEPTASGYQVSAQLASLALDAYAANGTARAYFCAGQVLVVKGSHVLLLTDSLTWFSTIYPFYIVSDTSYQGSVYCSAEAPLVLAGMSDSSGQYLRLFDLDLPENSKIVMDIPALGYGAIVSSSLIAYFNMSMSTEELLHGYIVSPPVLTAPKLSSDEFGNLTKEWSTNVFNVTVGASNRQGTVQTPQLVLRRMIHYDYKDSGLRSDDMAPWSLAMWCGYLLLIAVLTVLTVRAYVVSKFK